MARDMSRFGRPDEMSERQKALAQVRRIARPVKLLALIERLEAWPVDDNVVTAVMEAVEPFINGRLVVFFPGAKDGNNYRLLDARDGWNYLANSISAQSSGDMV